MTFVDTPGASPDAASEERGQAEAIARSIATMTTLRVPVVTVITGEGGSGGALAIAVGDVVLALENAIYSVISPEGCASILWRTPEAAQQAAVAMRLTAADQQALGVVDEVVPEPADGAHHDPEGTAATLREALAQHLERLVDRDPDGPRRSPLPRATARSARSRSSDRRRVRSARAQGCRRPAPGAARADPATVVATTPRQADQRSVSHPSRSPRVSGRMPPVSRPLHEEI